MVWPIRQFSRLRTPAFHQAYRAWRAERVARLASKPASSDRPIWYRYDDEPTKPVHPWTQARDRIGALREEVLIDLRYRSMPDELEMFHMALGIPPYVPVSRPWWLIAVWLFVTPFIPLRWRMVAGRAVLRNTRSFFGREYVYERLVSHLWSTQSSYSSGIDRALRALPLALRASSYNDLIGLENTDIDVLMRLGLNDVAAIPEVWRDLRRSYEPCVVHALIDEGILERLEELHWIPTRNVYHLGAPLKIDSDKLREMVRVLKSAGMPRARIPEILGTPYGYDPIRLSAIFFRLRTCGVTDVSAMYDMVGSALWEVDEDYWCFVLETIGARTPANIKRFRALLDLTHPAPVDIVTWMRARGASLDELADARDFLVQVAKSTTVTLSQFECLARAGLSALDIAHCPDYVLHDRHDRLEHHLAVLARHGYGDRASIMAFHSTYTTVSTWSLDRLLTVAGPLNDRDVAADVANWAVRAHRRGNVASLTYILAKTPAKSLDALNQRLFVMDLCPPLLRYVVEEQGLTDIRALYDWYYAEAWGAKDYAGADTIDAAERVLVEDAFTRKNFSVLEGNRKCLDEIVSSRARAVVPALTDRSEAGWAAYREALRQVETSERDALKPILAAMLHETHGVLLRSLLEAASQGQSSMSTLLSTFRPLMVDLARGRGPTGPSLSELEAEAVAVTYGVPTTSILEYWPRICVDDTQWRSWYREEPYLMRWQRNIVRVTRLLDHAGLAGLAIAAQVARRFGEPDISVFDAAKHLRGGVLANPLVDHHMLQRHLGVLLAAAVADDQVKEWVTRRLEAVSGLDDDSAVAHREIGALHDFFRVTLPDALDVSMEQFVLRMSASDARDLAQRLDASVTELDDTRAMLSIAMSRTREKVLQVYQRWSAREKKKFKAQRDAAHQSVLHAFVSKLPAAFFAKQATGLCSAGNTSMWQESRHAHLVVFDPRSGKLAGMALLYAEVIPDIDPARPSLIMRAINPTVSMVASHEPQSIVDAYFDLAIELAREHGLGSVAFPPSSGQDFMSNRSDIGRVIRERYEKRSAPFYRLHGMEQPDSDWRNAPRVVRHAFSAYEEGHGCVTTLYAIWRQPEQVQVQ
ncbi:macro domain-containing protein [Burkholderia cenocepacia]|uniref:macro domain-containing protein n=1 Tax=Burkholderia cenocepacia TaxID=95486 RepID=UPI002230D650|nr:macro domain-containing protein [Burkholderia cenocepacia]MCW3609120.1 macro domain-containing protein [Burkholderia cenocepacia]MCW5189954.1 macro domain-containing protein [Burkholderia cenocepacia]